MDNIYAVVRLDNLDSCEVVYDIGDDAFTGGSLTFDITSLYYSGTEWFLDVYYIDLAITANIQVGTPTNSDSPVGSYYDSDNDIYFEISSVETSTTTTPEPTTSTTPTGSTTTTTPEPTTSTTPTGSTTTTSSGSTTTTSSPSGCCAPPPNDPVINDPIIPNFTTLTIPPLIIDLAPPTSLNPFTIQITTTTTTTTTVITTTTLFPRTGTIVPEICDEYCKKLGY